jgi:hypothetical protein
MAMHLSLDIDYELADRITVANLKDCYQRLGNEIKDVKAIENKERWHLEDLEDFKRNRKAIKKTLRYFLTAQEAKEFFNE